MDSNLTFQYTWTEYIINSLLDNSCIEFVPENGSKNFTFIPFGVILVQFGPNTGMSNLASKLGQIGPKWD